MHTAPRRAFPPAPTQPRAHVLTAHPQPDSFNHALAGAWTQGAGDALEVEHIDVHALDFDPVLRVAYRSDQPLEPDLIRVRDALAQAAHLVVAYPLWWNSTPAKLKGLFDRLLLPGWAFRYEGALPVGGLAGRSARTLVTMDAPVWYDTLVNWAAGRRQVAKSTLAFCGIKPARVSAFGGLHTRTPAQREAMLQDAQRAGARDAAAVLKRLQRGATKALSAAPQSLRETPSMQSKA